MTTIGEAISRVRNTLKAVKEDPFLTDRTIYFSLQKYAQTLIKREDNQFRLMKMSQIFQNVILRDQKINSQIYLTVCLVLLSVQYLL
jgi:hypothetical protein